MAQPQGFRTFQILVAVGFLAGFFVVLLFFFIKISDLNTDLNRISIASQVKAQILTTLRDARACELNFSGLQIGEDPISLRKIVNLRKKAVLRVESDVDPGGIYVNALRILPNHKNISMEAKTSSFFLEMVFSDRESSNKSPIKILISGSGEYNDGNEFNISSCQAAINGTGD